MVQQRRVDVFAPLPQTIYRVEKALPTIHLYATYIFSPRSYLHPLGKTKQIKLPNLTSPHLTSKLKNHTQMYLNYFCIHKIFEFLTRINTSVHICICICISVHICIYNGPTVKFQKYVYNINSDDLMLFSIRLNRFTHVFGLFEPRIFFKTTTIHKT